MERANGLYSLNAIENEKYKKDSKKRENPIASGSLKRG